MRERRLDPTSRWGWTTESAAGAGVRLPERDDRSKIYMMPEDTAVSWGGIERVRDAVSLI